MKKLSVFILFSLLIQWLNAQEYVLKGHVKDSRGHSIASAEVMAMPSMLATTQTDDQGLFLLRSSEPIKQVKVRSSGHQEIVVDVNGRTFLTVILQELPKVIHQEIELDEVDFDMAPQAASEVTVRSHLFKRRAYSPRMMEAEPVFNTESYTGIDENGFRLVEANPLSTFSIDVDRASYSNVRRFLNQGTLPPKDAVREEEMINYFDYNYPDPRGVHPIAVQTTLTQAPWDATKQLLHIGLQAQRIEKEALPPSNLVFLIDVSGSMSGSNKLPLLKSSLNMLVDELRPEDRVALVVYAGAAGLVLPSTSGEHKKKIKAAISALSAGGSTAGGAGIKLAYKQAQAHFIKEGNNRVILASDGDFNVGASSDGEMQRLIEEKRDLSIYLTVLGFGMGNYKDSKMETLADHGNGNYAYIDNLSEARKTLIGEFGSTLFTVAKDVKVQVEFNPSVVSEYRLVGYENRMLNEEDFNDDKKDAGEMGAGHVVTAIYEILPVGFESGKKVDPLRYSERGKEEPTLIGHHGEAAMVKLRYKQPESSKSTRMEHIVSNEPIDFKSAPSNVQWSASIAAFGMKLRESAYVNDMGYEEIIKLAVRNRGEDPQGYRSEAVQLMRSASKLKKADDVQ